MYYIYIYICYQCNIFICKHGKSQVSNNKPVEMANLWGSMLDFCGQDLARDRWWRKRYHKLLDGFSVFQPQEQWIKHVLHLWKTWPQKRMNLIWQPKKTRNGNTPLLPLKNYCSLNLTGISTFLRSWPFFVDLTHHWKTLQPEGQGLYYTKKHRDKTKPTKT